MSNYSITIDPAVLEILIEADSFEEAEQEAMDIVLQHWEIVNEDELGCWINDN